MPPSSRRRYPEEFADRRATARDHLQASDSLREAARRAIDDGDLVLASEAYWGVVAHILQAVAETHGIPHSTNLDFERINNWLVAETHNEKLEGAFERSYRLHQNFYRIVLTQEEIRGYSHYALALADEVRDYA